MLATGNISLNSTEILSSMEGEFIRVLQLFCYIVIMTIGAVGNTLIFVAVLARKKRKISEYFILNLATTDLAVSLISIPLDIVESLSGHWPFGEFLCKVVYPLQTTLMSVSVFTLLSMSLERHRAIMYPLKPRYHRTRALSVIAFIWLGSIGLVAPYSYVLSLKETFCTESWPGLKYVKAYTMTVFLVLYLVPLMVISAAYIHVGQKLYNDIEKLKTVLISAVNGKQILRTRLQRNVHIVKIFTAAVVAFAVCLLPTHVVWLWHDFGQGSRSNAFSTILVFANIMNYTNSCINPFIFGTLQMRCNVCVKFLSHGLQRKNTSKLHDKRSFYSLRVSFTSSSRLYSGIRRSSVSTRSIRKMSRDRNQQVDNNIGTIGWHARRQSSKPIIVSNI